MYSHERMGVLKVIVLSLSLVLILWLYGSQKIYCGLLKLTVCNFERLKKCSKSWNFGPSDSVWKKLHYEDDRNFKMSENAVESRSVATNYDSYKVN